MEILRAKAVANIYNVNADGSSAMGVGLSQQQLAWCTNSANAYNKKITGILCSISGGGSSPVTITSDRGG